MNQDDQLHQNPRGNKPREFSPDAETLPPLDSKMVGRRLGFSRNSDQSNRSAGLSTGMAIALIFIGTFILGVLFTSAILAGIIEIQPAVIKGFFKSILGRS